MLKASRPILRRDSGVALVKALIVSAAILVLTTAGLVISRNDYVITGNVVGSRKALWTAIAGGETAKHWLLEAERFRNLGLFPARLPASGTTLVADGYDYVAELSIWDPDGAGFNDRFRIRSTSTGPDLASKTVEEIVHVAGLRFELSPINIHGTTSHAKFYSGGSSAPIPSFTVDGRDFDRTGKLAVAPCHAGAQMPVAGPADADAQTTARREAKELKCGLVQEALNQCLADGSNNGNNRTCTSGLHWIRSAAVNQSLSPTRNHADCSTNPIGPACCLNLNLAAPELRAFNPPTINQPPDCTSDPGRCPPDPKKRGPLTADTPGTTNSFYREIDLNALQATINQILDFGIAADNNVSCLATDVRNTTRRFGTMPDEGAAGPRIVVVPRQNSADPRLAALSRKACGNTSTNDLVIRDGTLEGTGILIVGRNIDVRENGLLHWRGLIVVMTDGEIRISDGRACGAVYGAIVLQDGAGSDPKIYFDNAGPSTCTNPFANDTDPTDLSDTPGPAQVDSFSVNYSCEAINAAFTQTTRTIAWQEDLSY